MLHQTLQQVLLHRLHSEKFPTCKPIITKEYDSQLYRKDTWICYFCQELCSCERCKKSEQITIERKGSKKRIGKTPPVIKNTGGEESIDNSQSNFSQSINTSKIP